MENDFPRSHSTSAMLLVLTHSGEENTSFKVSWRTRERRTSSTQKGNQNNLLKYTILSSLVSTLD
ncbi:Prostaglandin F2 Receptor Negative Regulator [Manis pentadactyla]|nr:Prostaglandin F2 Receptor Negative Regulator [Manis pentadactyla]